MTYGLIAVDAAVGELPRDGESVEHRGASHLASHVYEAGYPVLTHDAGAQRGSGADRHRNARYADIVARSGMAEAMLTTTRDRYSAGFLRLKPHAPICRRRARFAAAHTASAVRHSQQCFRPSRGRLPQPTQRPASASARARR